MKKNPSQKCPNCRLDVVAPHPFLDDCIAALDRTLKRILARKRRQPGAKR